MAMLPDELRTRLTGAIGFPVTPFRSDLSSGSARTPSESSADARPSSRGHRRGRWNRRALFVDAIRARRGRAHNRRGMQRTRAGHRRCRLQRGARGRPGRWRRRGRSRGHSRVSPVLSERRRPGCARVLPEHRGRDSTGTFHLQPRLVSSRTVVGRAAGHDSDAHRMEGRAGGHPASPDSDGRRRRPSAMDRRSRRRSGAGVLCRRSPGLHVERLECCAAVVIGAAHDMRPRAMPRR